MKRHFVTVDVFTDRPFGGNPLAVVLDAQGLSTERMQAIAAEFNYAETTFVLPPKDPAHTASVRIFTPKAEVPFAGHPNVGTAFMLAELGKVGGDKIVFEETAGLVPIDIVRENNAVIATRLAAPQQLTIGAEIATELVAEACGIAVEQIVTAIHRPVIASCGIGFVFAELTSRAALAAARVHLETFTRHFPMERVVGIHLYVRGKDAGMDIQTRMFGPLYGVPEDPATGSANVALIGLLAHHDPQRSLTMTRRIGQGFDMGRPSVLEACAEKKDGRVAATYIGGRCVPMMSGTLDLG
jgi:trans-2,3-dihydro-3-hydroxyanthranilate isomerase